MKKYILTFLISMVPIVELRGGVPFGITFGIPWYQALIICMIGNMLPVPFIFLFARKVLEWGKDKKYIGKFFTWCLEKVARVAKNFRLPPEKVCSGHY